MANKHMKVWKVVSRKLFFKKQTQPISTTILCIKQVYMILRYINTHESSRMNHADKEEHLIFFFYTLHSFYILANLNIKRPCIMYR